MRERTIEEVNELNDEEWGGPVECMDGDCQSRATKEILLTYENEPDKIFHTCLCESCAKEYCKMWDEANIFGEEAIEEDNSFQVK